MEHLPKGEAELIRDILFRRAIPVIMLWGVSYLKLGKNAVILYGNGDQVEACLFLTNGLLQKARKSVIRVDNSLTSLSSIGDIVAKSVGKKECQEIVLIVVSTLLLLEMTGNIAPLNVVTLKVIAI